MNNTIFRNKEVNEPFIITIEYEASEKPNFTWFDNNNQKIVFKSFISGNFFDILTMKCSKYFLKTPFANQVELVITNPNYFVFGNYTLNAQVDGKSENISVEVILEGKNSF